MRIVAKACSGEIEALYGKADEHHLEVGQISVCLAMIRIAMISDGRCGVNSNASAFTMNPSRITLASVMGS